MKVLLIDVGNTRLKWALVEGGAEGSGHPPAYPLRVTQQGVTGHTEWIALQRMFAGLPPPRKILVSNVAGDEAAQRVRTACAAWSCAIEFVTAKAEQCGVRNAYEQPAQLGSDRWAALIAAWHQERAACLVISCGTATTVDALSAKGEFLGGLILPGMDMMRRSLTEGTARLAVAEGNWREFPRNTADAIFSGAIKATVGAIRQQFVLLGVPGARCLLSGGTADRVQPHLELPLVRADNLVLRGLQIIGQETGA